jgi:hypothetical protein
LLLPFTVIFAITAATDTIHVVMTLFYPSSLIMDGTFSAGCCSFSYKGRKALVIGTFLALVHLVCLLTYKYQNSLTINSSTSSGNVKIKARTSSTTTQLLKHYKEIENDHRPYLIFHVGPPKTATSLLQEELTAWQGALARDNWIYGGSYYKHGDHVPHNKSIPVASGLKSLQCHRQLRTARLAAQSDNDQGSSNTAAQWWSTVTCWTNMLRNLERYRGQNILIMDETLSYLDVVEYRKERGPFDWPSLYQSLPEYQIHIMVNYRRYVDWVPSAKQQMERYKPAKPKLRNWPSKDGKRLEPLLPDFAFRTFPSKYILYRHTNEIVDALSPQAPVHVVNPYDPRPFPFTSLRSSFLCNNTHIFNAPHACALSLQQDELDKDQPPHVSNPSRSTDYDVLALAAADAGLVDPLRVRRRKLGLAMEAFHQQLLLQQQHNTTTTTTPDWPQICPERDVCERYLQLSIDREVALLPAFAATPQGTLEHTTQFWKAVAAQKYCFVDAEAILRQDEWRAFLQQYMAAVNNATVS